MQELRENSKESSCNRNGRVSRNATAAGTPTKVRTANKAGTQETAATVRTSGIKGTPIEWRDLQGIERSWLR
jgi:hypothetical protein